MKTMLLKKEAESVFVVVVFFLVLFCFVFISFIILCFIVKGFYRLFNRLKVSTNKSPPISSFPLLE